jgi:hypothetical protein
MSLSLREKLLVATQPDISHAASGKKVSIVGAGAVGS